MPGVAGSTRFVFNGEAASSKEIFSTGFWVTGLGVDSLEDLEAILAALLIIWVSEAKPFWLALIPNTSAYLSCTAYYYASESDTATYVAVGDIAGAVGSSGAGSVNPIQTCMVNSLRTGRAGRAYRGRMYLPATGSACVGHLFNSDTVDNTAAATAAFFTSINGAAGVLAGASVCVLSRVHGSATPVIEVIVNNTPTIQRRRTDSFLETHEGQGVVS